VKRGELWVAAGGGHLSKPRPVLIIQDDRFINTDSVTVCLLTSVDAEADLWRVEVPSDTSTGLETVSYVQIDKVTTTQRDNLARRIGAVSVSQMREVGRLLAAFLGMAA